MHACVGARVCVQSWQVCWLPAAAAACRGYVKRRRAVGEDGGDGGSSDGGEGDGDDRGGGSTFPPSLPSRSSLSDLSRA